MDQKTRLVVIRTGRDPDIDGVNGRPPRVGTLPALSLAAPLTDRLQIDPARPTPNFSS